jgi:uncharacterized phage protein (TIGR02220 family)
MAKYRPVLMSIWKDPDFEEYTPIQKLIFIYLFTNQSTTESGIYSITLKAISNETGIPLATVRKEITAIKNIIYDDQSKCVFVVKFLKHNGSGRPDLLHLSILKDAETYHTTLWKLFIKEHPQHNDKELQSIIKHYPDPEPSLLNTISVSNSKEPIVISSTNNRKRLKITPELKELCIKITNHLNDKAGKKFQPFSQIMTKFISERKNDGYTLEQFIQVIDTKVPQWINTDKEKFLSPDTLFNMKMEKYLQENVKKPPPKPQYYCYGCRKKHQWKNADTKKCDDAEKKRLEGRTGKVSSLLAEKTKAEMKKIADEKRLK